MSETSLAVPGQAIPGFENILRMGNRYLVMPMMSIVQHQSTAKHKEWKGQEGKLRNNISGETTDQILMVILRADPSRAMFVNPGDRSPACRSDDGLHPRALGLRFGQYAIPPDCARCKFAQWDGQNPPKCNDGLKLLCQDALSGEQFIVVASRTSLRPVRVLLTRLFQKRTPTFGVVVRLKTTEISGDKGAYFVLDPSIEEWLDEEKAAPYHAQWEALRGVVVDTVEEEGEAATPPVSEEPPSEGDEDIQF